MIAIANRAGSGRVLNHRRHCDFDPNTSYDERKDLWKLPDKIVRTRNITQSAVGDRNGLWTSVVAAVFVDLSDDG